MAAAATEAFESRPTAIGSNAIVDLRYNMAGKGDDQAACAAHCSIEEGLGVPLGAVLPHGDRRGQGPGEEAAARLRREGL